MRLTLDVPGPLDTVWIEQVCGALAYRRCRGIDDRQLTQPELIPMVCYGEASEFAGAARFLAFTRADYRMGAAAQDNRRLIRIICATQRTATA